MSRIERLLRQLKEDGGSDLHLAAGLVPRMRRRGHIEEIADQPVLSDADLRAMLSEITSEEQWRGYESDRDLDFAHAIPGVARFRANYLAQENGAAAVFRIVPERVLSAEDLGLPPAIASLAELAKGLVLVTGPTGSGKSTTLAAVIDRINRSQAKHVVTIEDPVEFVHENQRSVFSHREVGAHTGSFGAALRATLRQDADVVLVGEMRDRETIGLAITAAEMGLLVFGTLHTNGAAKTIDRIIDAFPAHHQGQVRSQMSLGLLAVVAQRLVPRSDRPGRVAAVEVLRNNTAVANLVRDGKTHQLYGVLETSAKDGMRTMDAALKDLYLKGLIAFDEARTRMRNPSQLGA